ncbi:PX domain-containing protein [Aspergillus sclerotialis]|uniref:Endosomal/vacuolar adapter protein YPT35 n=1 Tax=Aspergillus sclerotialis TaxID=2070753 RepID=A0A3A2ZP18_9EURO|nr:PX domain-containing protein [Aspergillus sclerotialis]
MDSANEESSPAPRPQSLASAQSPPTTSTPDTNDLVTTSDSNDVNVSSRTVPSGSDGVSSRDRPVSGVIPPYWHHARNSSRTSQTSQTSLDRLPAITLEDHTEDPDSETSRGLWARSVTIDDHVVVQGKTGIGAYVVWNCKVQTLDGGPMTIRMRYSEFDDLRQRLLAAFQHAKSALPPLPPKSVLCSDRRFSNPGGLV